MIRGYENDTIDRTRAAHPLPGAHHWQPPSLLSSIPLCVAFTIDWLEIHSVCSISRVGSNALPDVVSISFNFFLLPSTGHCYTGGPPSPHVHPQAFD
jgi:hypothetical protein